MQGYHESVESAQISLASTGDKYTWTPTFPVDIIRWGLVLDVLLDVGAGATVKADKRPTAGSDSGRGDGDVGALVTTADIAQGKVWNDELAAPVQINPGEQVVVDVTDAADTAGTAIAYFHYRRRPFQSGSPAAGSDRLANVVAG